MWLLTDDRTGRFWRYASRGQAVRAAMSLGLTNYTLGQVAK